MINNTVGELSSLPVEIQEFYSEEVRLEPTGEEVTYLVIKPRGETQANTVYQLVNNRSIERVNQFLGFENNGLAWGFHDAYISWLGDEPKEAERARNEDGTYIADDPDTPELEQWLNGITPEAQGEAHTAWLNQKPIRLQDKVLNDFPEYDTYLKLKGVEFEGVMCSATKEDFWGLAAVEDFVRAGNQTVWEFDNGNTLLLTKDNIELFYAVWVPFRLQFFG